MNCDCIIYNEIIFAVICNNINNKFEMVILNFNGHINLNNKEFALYNLCIYIIRMNINISDISKN